MEVVTKKCKHGTFSYYEKDMYVGKSLDRYGEFSEDEVSIFDKVLTKDDVAIEVGANIGALTVPMAKRCKKVFAFEPHPQNAELLTKNILQNELPNVYAYDVALDNGYNSVVQMKSFEELGHTNFGSVDTLSTEGSYHVACYALDDYFCSSDEKIKFIKIDAEGSELNILCGARATISRNRPIMYIENDRKEKSVDLIAWLLDHNYTLYWHCPPLFHKGNFFGEHKNYFGNTVSMSMICVPNEMGIKIDRLDEIADQRIDPEMHNRECTRMLKKLERDPTNVEARFQAAHYHALMGRLDEARSLIAENLKLAPDDPATNAIQGLLDLQAGDFKKGWPAYELRYKQKDTRGFGFREHPVPHWDGKPTDKPLLIWNEQGFGDSIMFGRFMKYVMEIAPNAFLEVQPQLFELFELSGIVPQGHLFRTGRTMPEYELHCSLPSIPATLGLTDIGPPVERYLSADPTMVKHWTNPDRPMPKIGICTRGGAASERAYSRDMPIELGDALADKFGPFMSLANDGQWESYADTAAAIESLDLVLTVDTSVAHLSGALGVPTILMLSFDPDWRWMRDREYSDWYPSMRIVRQKHFMDWSDVISEVESILEKHKA